MSAVAVYSYTYSVAYVTDNILKSLKDILVLSGLDPGKLVVQEWDVLQRGISRWIETQDLLAVSLEIYDPNTDALIRRFDFSVVYTWSSDAGNFWVDTDALRYAILKLGLYPSQAKYRVVVDTKPHCATVNGWSSTTYRSTAGMVRQSLGTTVEHNGLGANAGYWRKA